MFFSPGEQLGAEFLVYVIGVAFVCQIARFAGSSIRSKNTTVPLSIYEIDVKPVFPTMYTLL
jgi:hypothetical protein